MSVLRSRAPRAAARPRPASSVTPRIMLTRPKSSLARESSWILTPVSRVAVHDNGRSRGPTERNPMAQRVCVTGASGQAGRAVVADLREHGYDVTPTDIAVSRADREDGMLQADLTDYGQAVEALAGANADAVVHLANIPAPGLSTPAVTFNSNITMNFNVFQAAAALKLSRVVWTPSETTLGLPFDTPPRYAPIDEDHFPYPTTTYALSKVVGEALATQISGWSGIPFVALRLSNVFTPEEYERVPSFWANPHERKWNLWGYIDVRDAAAAGRLALDAPV